MTNLDAQHPTRAMAVANWFLERSWQENPLPSCDQMKLYKLVYYAHGWFLGNQHTELFPEDVKAWPHGPVVPDLYGQFKQFGSGYIAKTGKRLEIGTSGKVSFVTPKHDGSLSVFFESIWGAYGKFTGIQLSNMTHEVGEPWQIVAEKYRYDLSSKPTIPTEIIESVFAKKVESTQQAN